MNAMNQIIIEGNVVREPNVKATPRGTKVSTLSIASNRSYKDGNGAFQDEVSYFDVQAWGDIFCEKIVKNSAKGRGVRVIGRLKQDRWKDGDGKNQVRYYIVADHIDFKPVYKNRPADVSESSAASSITEVPVVLSQEETTEYKKAAGAENTF